MFHISKDLRRRLLQNRIYLYSLLILLGLLGFLAYWQPGIGYEVVLNGKHVGYVKKVAHIESLADDVDRNLREAKGQNITYEAKFDYIKGKLGNNAITDDVTLQSNIVAGLDIKAPAILIKTNGSILMAVNSESDAQEVLDKIQEPFLKNRENAKAEFVQEVSTVRAHTVSIDKIISKQQAIAMVSPNREVAMVTRSNLFRKLEDKTPQPRSTTNIPPVLDVKVTYNDKAKLPVYRAEQRVADASMTEGQVKVVDEGTNGIKEVRREVVEINGEIIDKSILSETILSQSTPKIVAYGTKPKVSGIVSIARRYLGVPYRWGGTTPNGFDCSGFTQYVYRKAGVSIPRTSYEQRFVGKKVSRSELRSGDLVLFPGHVGIYVGDGMYIHAPQPGQSVKISSLSSSSKRLLFGRRVY